MVDLYEPFRAPVAVKKQRVALVAALLGVLFTPVIARAAEPEATPAPWSNGSFQIELNGQGRRFLGTLCSAEGDVVACMPGAFAAGAQGAMLYRAPRWVAAGVVAGVLGELSGSGVASSSGGGQTDRFSIWHAGLQGRLYPLDAASGVPTWLDAWVGLGTGIANVIDTRTQTQDGVVTSRTSLDQWAFQGEVALGVAFTVYRGLYLGSQVACSFLASVPRGDLEGDGSTPQHTNFDGNVWLEVGLLTIGYRLSL